MTAPRPWFLYLLECRNGAWYAGISTDVEARFQAHLAGKGARYTRANPPLRLLGSRAFPDRAAASRAEWEIKRLPRERKLAFLLEASPDGAGAASQAGSSQPS
ncbi:GIY-YIG nuclease family protein [Pseudoxanthomonas suwonensis]|uniref:GIY-YIG nuclease family protein n=1 Tax=Pseudoxanthomonas suwonensis TaxID=314722 RepID=UPI00048BB0DF|nr:GIY-YIG nuclease family protein [Pseudoxanthomonas suwonensis]